MFAEFGYSTFCAAGAPRQTNVSAVQNQPVVRLCQQWFWEMFCQLLLTLQRRLCIVSQSDSCRYSEHVRIYGHNVHIEQHCAHYICSLSPHAGQLLQPLQISGQLSAELLGQFASHCPQILCLIVWIRDALDPLPNSRPYPAE